MLTIEPLTPAAFAPFGDIIAVDAATQCFPINAGYTERYHALAAIESNVDADQKGHAAISIFRSTPLPLPLRLKSMERHPQGSQAFFPLSGVPFLVLVATPGAFDPTTLRLFLASPSQGVNYHAGTWHHFCLALDRISDFLVVDRVGGSPNCDEIHLPMELVISADAIAAARAEVIAQ